MSENIKEGEKTWETPKSGNEQGVVEWEVGGVSGDWVRGTEGGTWWDEHWVLCCMLANWTPIQKKEKKKDKEKLKS